MMPCLRGGSFRVIVSLLALPRWLVVGCGVVSLLLGGGPRADAQNPRSHLLIITGAPGEPRFAEKFSASARAIRQAAGLPAGQAQVLSGSTSMSDADGRATRDNMLAAIRSIAESSSRGDQVTIVLIGHGSGGEGNSFNLTGPDIGAAELASALNSLAGRQLTIVVAASAAGGWVPALAAPGRVVIAATRTPFERNESVFHTHFAQAFVNGTADVDKDGRVSMLEAFLHAAREVEREYASSSRLQTEHAVLDDNGDGEGSSAPGAAAADGRLAATRFLAPAATAVTSGSPGSDSLLAERRRVELALEELRSRRADMQSDEYERQLEALVTRLAEIRRALEPPREES